MWKTDKAWAGQCRELIVRLSDGTEHLAHFQFKCGDCHPNASDSLSGLASAMCNQVNTNSVDNSAVTCTATDNAGNVTSTTASYLVKYQFLGFLSPLPQSSYKVGKTIHVQFRLGNAFGTPISDTEAQSLVVACRVKVGLDTPNDCASYDASTDSFGFDVKILKPIFGTHQIVVLVRASDNSIVATATTTVVLVF